MAHSLTTKGIYFSRREFIQNSKIEILFKLSSLKNTILLEGRLNANDWDKHADRGVFQFNADGKIYNSYKLSYTLTDMETGNNVTTYKVDTVYKLSMESTASSRTNKFICKIGSSFDQDTPRDFDGEIYSVKATNFKVGYNSGNANEYGEIADLNLQLQHLRNDDSTPVDDKDQIYIKSINQAEGVDVTVDTSESSGWTHSNGTYTKNADAWDRLYLISKTSSTNGRKEYDRIVRIEMDVEIPTGKELYFYYRFPDGAEQEVKLSNGKFVHYCLVENGAKHGIHERFKLDSNTGAGVKVSNIKMKEMHGAIIQGGSWKGNIIKNGHFTKDFTGWYSSNHWKLDRGRAHHPHISTEQLLKQDIDAKSGDVLTFDHETTFGRGQMYLKGSDDKVKHKTELTVGSGTKTITLTTDCRGIYFSRVPGNYWTSWIDNVKIIGKVE